MSFGPARTAEPERAAAAGLPEAAARAENGADAARPILRLRGIRKQFGAVQVLHGIDLDVMENEVLTVLGPSGSGKTTILRLIGGFEAPSAGSVFFEGADITRLPINRRPFNTVFQDYALFPHMSVRRNVAYGLRVRGLGRAETARRVDAVLATVGLEGKSERLPSELSGGQRQRVALARAIVLEPRLILLDEPLAALDVELRAQMQRFLKDLQRRLGITFLFITHDQEEAMTLSDRITVMRDGRIEQTGTPEELYRSPATLFVAGFLGENNLIPGTAAGAAAGAATVQTALGLLRCRGQNGAVSGAVTVALRPEAVTLGASGGTDNCVPCRVERVQFAGASLLVDLRSVPAGILLRARLSSRQGEATPRAGDSVAASWAAADAVIVASPS